MIEHSQDIRAIAAALLAAQASMGAAKKDAKNPHFKSTYATLETVIETAKPALQAQGIAFLQAPGQLVDGALEVTTMLIHGESGQWVRSTLHVPLQKRDPQGVGSAITYACRYSLMAMLGIPATDDDGEGAMERQPKSKADSRELYSQLEADIRRLDTREDLIAWWQDEECRQKRATLPDDWQKNLRAEWEAHGKAISNARVLEAG